jgi:hypothetical protein
MPAVKGYLLMACLLVGGCATAGSDDGSIDSPGPDASGSTSFPDAAPRADARPLPDASTLADASIPVDAQPSASDGGLICDDSSQCTQAGTCCFSLGGPGFCVPGEEVVGVCVPD